MSLIIKKCGNQTYFTTGPDTEEPTPIVSTTAILEPPEGIYNKHHILYITHVQLCIQIKDAEAVTTPPEGDAVLLKILVVTEKETVMDVVMEVSMMVMRVVREILYVGVTTA